MASWTPLAIGKVTGEKNVLFLYLSCFLVLGRGWSEGGVGGGGGWAEFKLISGILLVLWNTDFAVLKYSLDCLLSSLLL